MCTDDVGAHQVGVAPISVPPHQLQRCRCSWCGRGYGAVVVGVANYNGAVVVGAAGYGAVVVGAATPYNGAVVVGVAN